MKRNHLFFVLLFLLTACQQKLNLPAINENNRNLNTLATLEVGDNKLFLQDYILNPTEIYSVTSNSKTLKITVSGDKMNATLAVEKSMEQFVDIKIWAKGIPYSVPCLKTDKIDYTFTFNPNGKSYNRVQLAGQMNDWTASRTPDLMLNSKGLYEVSLNVSPGTYMYQLKLDGDQNSDPTNPNKVDNGYGKFNSIMQVPGNDEKFHILLTNETSAGKFSLITQNKVNEVFAYWQNYRLPDRFISIKNGKINVIIPSEARKTER